MTSTGRTSTTSLTRWSAKVARSCVAPVSVRRRHACHAQADLRYVGQGHEVTVPVPDGELERRIRRGSGASFEQVYRRLYERIATGQSGRSALLAGDRLGAPAGAAAGAPGQQGPIARADAGERDQGRAGDLPAGGSRDASRCRSTTATCWRRGDFDGPAIVEERESTLSSGSAARGVDRPVHGRSSSRSA